MNYFYILKNGQTKENRGLYFDIASTIPFAFASCSQKLNLIFNDAKNIAKNIGDGQGRIKYKDGNFLVSFEISDDTEYDGTSLYFSDKRKEKPSEEFLYAGTSDDIPISEKEVLDLIIFLDMNRIKIYQC